MKNTKERIKALNDHLKKVGSKFGSDDGLTFVRYCGNLVFLRKTYQTIEEAEKVIFNIK